MVTDGESIKVLVVEDEESYRQALVSGLGREGFDVEVAADGVEALRRFADRPPDIVLLDILLPGMRGIEVCRRMRELSSVPIVMVSAVDAELDVVLGFELGASGYVTKPFRLRELVARMHAILRRVAPQEGTEAEAGPLDTGLGAGTPEGISPLTSFGSVTVDFVRREVTVAGTRTHLSRREFDLLAVLLSQSGLLKGTATWVVGPHVIPLAVIVYGGCDMVNWFGFGLLWILGISLIADAAEVNELETGVRKDGGYAAIYSFTTKLVASVAVLAAGCCLKWVGFASGSDHQTPQAIHGLVFLAFGLGAFFAALVIPFALRCDITQGFMKDVKAALAQKRAGT